MKPNFASKAEERRWDSAMEKKWTKAHEARMRLIMAPLGIVERIAPKTWAGVLIRDSAFVETMGRAGTSMFSNFEDEDFGHIGRSDNIE